jgi:hypothetical protein
MKNARAAEVMPDDVREWGEKVVKAVISSGASSTSGVALVYVPGHAGLLRDFAIDGCAGYSSRPPQDR